MATRKYGIDGASEWLGIWWDDPNTARIEIRPELINAGGMLSGVVTFGIIDYVMGSALWAQRREDESVATTNIAINYVATATEGEIVCTCQVDRRTRSNAVLRSEVRHADGRLLATAIGTYAIFPRRGRPEAPAS